MLCAHNISDKIYMKIQGISGIFSTRLAYIDKPSIKDKNYHLRISDIDGFNGVSLFSSPQPIMSPNWSPKGDKMAYVSFELKRNISHLISFWRPIRRHYWLRRRKKRNTIKPINVRDS